MALQHRHTPTHKTHKTQAKKIYYFLSKQTRILLSKALPNICHKRRASRVNWSDLPIDLLELIFERLLRSCVGDLIRVSEVCKSWQLVADSIRQQQQQQQQTCPFFLLLPPEQKNDDKQEVHYHLFDFFENKVKKLLLPKPSDQVLFKAWNEWIVTFNRSPGDHYYQIGFSSLFSMARVELPRLSSMLTINPVSNKIIASSTPSDPHCIFMACCTGDKTLAFCKQGDKEWNMVRGGWPWPNDEYNYLKDIVHYKGEFYALPRQGNLVVFEIDGPEPKAVHVTPTIPTTALERACPSYLVESSGDLFWVMRTISEVKKSMNSDTFKVHKLDIKERKWQKVNRLGNHSAIILGEHNVSMSISAKDFPVKRDCIYITDKKYQFNGFREFALFNLKTKIFEPTYLFSSKRHCP